VLDFDKYKNRLKQYLKEKGVDTSKSPTHCFNQSGHKNGDANPSMQLHEDNYKCFGCGITGDIFDAVEILEGITDKSKQYEFVEKFFNGAPVAKIEYKSVWGEKGEKFKPDPAALAEIEKFCKQNPAGQAEIKKFLCKRAEVSVGAAAYPPDVESYIVDQFFYWSGLDDVAKHLSRDLLKRAGIPLQNPNTGHSTWEHSGVVMRLGKGLKLHYYERRYCDNCKEKDKCPKCVPKGSCEKCEKRTSKGGETFPMPGSIDVTAPVVLVEGEMDALSCAGMGIKNLFAAGGTEGLTGPKVKAYLLNAPEIILFYDPDEAGRKASGLERLGENDKRKTSIPQIIRRAEYAGIIKIAELPPQSETGYKDHDALILGGKREVITAALASAREWVPPPPPPKKVYMPFDKFNFLSIKRLQVLLKKLERKLLDKKDIAPFVSACLAAFSHGDTPDLLRKWGATESELTPNPEISPYILLPIIQKHLSRYLVTEIEREITPIDEFIKHIKIQDTKFDLDFDEIEISQNARNFNYTGGVRSAALMLAEIFDGKVIYNNAKNDKRFYFYDGHVWQHEPDIAGVIYNTLLSVLVFFAKNKKKVDTPPIDEEADAEAEKKRFFYIINKIEDRRTRTDIEKEFSKLKAEGVYHNSDDEFDPLHFDGEIIRETLTLQDCVLDMSGEKLVFRKSRPDEYRKDVLPYTKKQVTESPVNFFWEFMRGNFHDKDTLNTFIFYLSLIASRTQCKYGAFFIGGKNTGKSTTIKMIEGIYRHLIGTMDTDVLVPKDKTFATGNGPTPYLAALEGLCASIISETEDGAVLNAGLWKKLTGGDRIPARGLNEAPKKFVNTAQIIIASNMLPRFNRHDTSVITRMVVIPFLVSHERDAKDTKRPENIMTALTPEFPGIVRVLAEYYIELKNKLNSVIPVSKESESYKTEIIAENENDLDKFVSVCISFEKNQMEVIKDAYEKYLAYLEADENSVKRGEALSRIRFTKFILKNYKDFIYESVQRVRGSKPSRAFVGLRIRTLEEIAEIEAASKKAENASTQVKPEPAAQAPGAVAPLSEPPGDENPF
jgi:phage/plasmid-associated DNA primase/5S rRNA maturation endonuclease (ribonuclease M5)